MDNLNLINKEQYQNTLPFPYISINNILNEKFCIRYTK